MERCLNCMEIYDEQYDICPYCGYKRGTPAKIKYHLQPGTVIADRYIIGTVIGYGGFGVTYVAWDSQLSIKIAVKEFYPNGLVSRAPETTEVIELSRDENMDYHNGLMKFLDEAKTLAKFNKEKNIVHVYDYLRENNTAYIIMEYIDGQTLEKYLKNFEDEITPVDEAISIVKDIAAALSIIHKEGIIHRDISPGNIMLSDGEVKILDFGAARMFAAEKSQNLSVILKPGYAPPEQYGSNLKQDERTDVYALGAVLYKLVTGKMPPEALERTVESEIKRPGEINVDIPAWLDGIIVMAMNMEPAKRFQNADEFKEALNKGPFFQGKGITKEEAEIRRLNKMLIIFVFLITSGTFYAIYWYSNLTVKPDWLIQLGL